MEIVSIDKIILIICSNGVRSSKCGLILGNVSASTQDIGTKMYTIQCVVLFYLRA